MHPKHQLCICDGKDLQTLASQFMNNFVSIIIMSIYTCIYNTEMVNS